NSKEWNSGDDQLRLRWMIYLVVLADAAESLKAARDRQKSYADNRRKPLEFEVGDRVMLKVSPWKGVIRFGKKGKLAPRYVGPFEILERIGHVAYRLRLPEKLSGVHDTFHVSNLNKCLADASLHVPLDEIKMPLCCDEIYDVTPRISALARFDRLVSEPLVIENILAIFFPTRKKSHWGTVFPTGLKRYKVPLVEPKEIG
ncbi:hypothetical protein Tco_0687595, partial [Tanacetum coccineum]